MKKLMILLVFITLVGGVYYSFVFIKDKKEKEINETMNPKSTKQPMNKERPINTIDYSYQPICLSYIKSIEYQIEVNLLTGKSIPEIITDPNYVSSREIPEAINIEVNNKGTVEKGTVTYEHVICNYENGTANLEKRTN